MNKNFSLLFLALSCSLAPSLAQESIATRYANEITAADASKHLHIIASDEMEGRETGKPGNDKAAAYIAEQFKKMGLKAPVNGSYFQPVELAESRFDVKYFKANGQELISGNDFFMPNSGAQNTISTNEIWFIGYGIDDEKYSDLAGLDLQGKVVLLINSGEPTKADGTSYITGSKTLSDWATSRNKRIQTVMSKSPALVLATSPEVANMLERVRMMGSGGRMQIKEDVKEPTGPNANRPTVAYVTTEAANKILQNSGHTYESLKKAIDDSGKAQSQALKSSVETSFAVETIDVKSQNVLAYLEGTDLKDELLVISGHYDHIGVNPDGQINNGADDDGSGTTGVIEMAQAFAKAKADGKGPRRSILFLTVTGEEKGLLGSDYYTRHPVFPLANTVTNLNIDMIGRIDPPHEADTNYVYLVGSDKLSSQLHAISEEANNRYTKFKLDYKYNDPEDPERIYYRSDHYNFAKNGIPVIFYFNGVHADYHNVGDTVDKIDFNLLARRTQLVFYTAWDVANRDQRPLVDSNKK
ncbi:M28 family peptidase [Olivibacter sitiensis]|uniref:M28 family peptidase n=1 Tax=Olivibacter sitiensis TaxID=376470 RepID=UPI0003F69170|nr:M28 family peptidase [Olivibacter sitiensis]